MRFALLLARTLGRTLHELCETMTAEEFWLWVSEFKRSPWGEQRDDLHAAMIARTVADYAGKTRNGAAKLEEFLFKFGEQEEEIVTEPDPISHFKSQHTGE